MRRLRCLCLLALICLLPLHALAVTPSDEPGWFAGDWVGYRYLVQENPEVNGFGDLMPYLPDLAALSVYPAGDGYEATLSNARFTVTAYDAQGFTLTCTENKPPTARPTDGYMYLFDWPVGTVIAFTYEPYVPNTAEGTRAPERDILHGRIVSVPDTDNAPHRAEESFLLASLPSGTERTESDGELPYWYGGYENMQGSLRGIFILAENQYSVTHMGLLFQREGQPLGVTEARSGLYMTIEPRDPRAEDVTVSIPFFNDKTVWWPYFTRFDSAYASHEVAGEHRAYYADTYIPLLRASFQNMPEGLNAFRKESRRLAYNGLIHYAEQAANGTLDARLLLYAPDLLRIDARFLPEGRLAGIAPGDTLADAQALYTLTEITREALAEQRIWLGNPQFSRCYTDGDGLFLSARTDTGLIDDVCITKNSYGEIPTRYALGDIAPDAYAGSTRVRDGIFRYDMEYSADDITLTATKLYLHITLDQVWDTLEMDIDGDGTAETLTLSGRSHARGIECYTMLGTPETGPDPLDFGTKTRLSVYRNGALIEETMLSVYTHTGIVTFAPEAALSPSVFAVRTATTGTGNSPEYTYYQVNREAKDIYSVTYWKYE